MKRLILLFVVLLTSCVQEVIEPIPTKPSNIFSQKETVVADKEEINFELVVGGTYFVSLVDVGTNQVVSREKIVGVKGSNKLNIYTKSIESRYLYLVLTDNNKSEVNRTKLIFK